MLCWVGSTLERVGSQMNCSHHMWDEPTGARCTRSDSHDEAAAGGHVYESNDGSCTNPSEGAPSVKKAR